MVVVQSWGWGAIGSPRLVEWLHAYKNARSWEHFAWQGTGLIRNSLPGPGPLVAWSYRAREAGWEARKLDQFRSCKAAPAPNRDVGRAAWSVVVRILADATGLHPNKWDGLGLYLCTERKADRRPDLEEDYQTMMCAIRGREREVAETIATALREDPRCSLVARDALAAFDESQRRRGSVLPVLRSIVDEDPEPARLAIEAGASRCLWKLLEWVSAVSETGVYERDLAKHEDRSMQPRANVDCNQVVWRAMLDALRIPNIGYDRERLLRYAEDSLRRREVAERQAADALVGLLRASPERSLVASDLLAAWDKPVFGGGDDNDTKCNGRRRTLPAPNEGEYRPATWFPKGMADRLRQAASKKRKTKRVAARTIDGVVCYSVADARRWWPSNVPKEA